MQMRGVIEAMSVKPTNTGILVGGNWYSAYKGKGMKGIEKGDEVEFEYTEKGQYRNISDNTVKKIGGGNGAAPAAGNKPYAPSGNQIGMELGHASKLALHFAVATFSDYSPDDLFSVWTEWTPRFYAEMKKMRAQAERGFPAPPQEPDGDYDADSKPF